VSKQLAVFYRTLGQSLGNGLPLAKALKLCPAPRGVSRHLSERLLAGDPWEKALADAPAWLPWQHRPILTAAAESGRLPETLAQLAEQAERRHTRFWIAIGASAYPFFLIHFAALVLPVSTLVNGTVATYARQVLAILIPLWLVVFGLWMAAKALPSLAFSAGLFLPGIRGWLKNAELAQAAFLLEAQISAGVNISRAWETVARATRWDALKSAADAAARTARGGSLPSESFQSGGALPQTFIQFYTSGEASGQLEQNLRALWAQHDDQSLRSLTGAAIWYPKLLYIACAFWIALKIIEGFRNYLAIFDSLNLN
jgi:type II secretory pathway component PulF